MIFLRPKILNDASEAAIETNSKYNQIREVLRGSMGDDVNLMPRAERPQLPPLEGHTPQEDGD